MKVYEVRKEVSRDNGETLDLYFRAYGKKDVADHKVIIMNKHCLGNHYYYVKEVDYDNSPRQTNESE